MSRLAIGILASGSGTNFDAIAAAREEGRLDVDIKVLVCNRASAPVIAKAERRKIKTRLINHKDFADRRDFDRAIVEALTEAGVGLVVLAGFDRIVTSALLEAFPDRVINIHPALLPSFVGSNAQQQAADYGVTITGATVHLVDEQTDHGPIIIQAAVPLIPGEDSETIRRRILVQEHRIYPYAIQLFAEDRIRVDGRFVRIDGRTAITEQCLVSPPLDGGNDS